MPLIESTNRRLAVGELVDITLGAGWKAVYHMPKAMRPMKSIRIECRSDLVTSPLLPVGINWGSGNKEKRWIKHVSNSKSR